MRSDIKTIEYYRKYKDYFEYNFQLDYSFQRIYALINDEEVSNELSKKEAMFGKFSCELFRNTKADGDFDLFDHIEFLQNLKRFTIPNSHYSTDGREVDIGAGLLVLVENEVDLDKLNEAIAQRLDVLRVQALNKIGGEFDGYSAEDLEKYKTGKIEHHKKRIKDLEERTKDYVPTSERYREMKKDIKKERQLLKALTAQKPKSDEVD